jgi:acyl-CoA reductase-like NAD-dependent aldehyde dehydrogenase
MVITASEVNTIDPSTGAPIAGYPAFDPDRIEASIAAAHTAAATWGTRPVGERCALLARLAGVLRTDADSLAALVVREMGKPWVQATAEIEKCARTAEYYAENAEAALTHERIGIEGADASVAHEPVGVIYAVMPWNFPFWQVLRFAIPALAAGNTVLLKHSPNVTGCALELEEVLRRAGFPAGVLTALVIAEGDVARVSDEIIADDRVAAVTLTGSNAAGAAVGAAAGQAVKKSVLELGGSDAFVVLDDADLERAAIAAVDSRFQNAGQSCVCAKRFLVASSVAEEFTRLVVRGTEELVVGNPFTPGVNVGPLARADLLSNLHRQVVRSVQQGAQVLCGGHPLDGPGYFYRPTVVTGTRPGITAFDEETFGPVAAIATASTDDALVELANATPFGLGLSIWSGDGQRALGLARRITTGMAFVNAVVASDPRVPFGGTKRSGHGRELGLAGLREFTTTRTYWVAR